MFPLLHSRPQPEKVSFPGATKESARRAGSKHTWSRGDPQAGPPKNVTSSTGSMEIAIGDKTARIGTSAASAGVLTQCRGASSRPSAPEPRCRRTSRELERKAWLDGKDYLYQWNRY